MSIKPKKLAIIGLDAAIPKLLEKHVADGSLPNIKKLIDTGVIAENLLVQYPTITPPNWTTIATGATVGTHQVTDFWVQKVGDPLEPVKMVQAFSSERSKAEFIWDVLDKAGKKSIVLNWPGSWPTKMKNGIMVGGAALAVNENRDGLPFQSTTVSICHDQLVTTGIYPYAIQGQFEPAYDWKGVNEAEDDNLEMKFNLRFRVAKVKPVPTTWYLLARQGDVNGYDTLTLSPEKDLDKAFCTLKVGEWSKKITTSFTMPDGTIKHAWFRCKLLELSPDAENLRLLLTSFVNIDESVSPKDVLPYAVSEDGIPAPMGSLDTYSFGWFDLDTWVEIQQLYCRYLSDVAVSLMKNTKWDAFFMHAHPPDFAYHAFMSDLYEELTPDPEKRQQAWKRHLQVYKHCDDMVGQILEVLTEDTLVILVSDHGATADGPFFNPNEVLGPAGLTVYEEVESRGLESMSRQLPGIAEEGRIMQQKADPARSKAIPLRMCYIYVNLKGRDPQGIVEPADYEKVQQQIIDSLYQYVDPRNGKRPVSLALSKKDARILGLHGNGVGDVVYAIYPWFGSQHGNILPTAEWGEGSLKALLVMNGPLIRSGYRITRTCGLQDIVPTVCYLLDWPLPQDVEGAVLYQVFSDPNFKAKEVSELKDSLKNMESALQGKEQHSKK